MNLDNGLTLAAILAAASLLIRAFANLLNSQSKRADTDTALIASLVSRTDALSSTLQTVLLAQVAGRDREVEAAHREGDLKAKIALLEMTSQQKDEALAILKKMVPQVAGAFANSTLANQQLSTLQHTVAVGLQPDDTSAADAALVINREKDHDAKQGNEPASPMVQEVPPQPPTTPPANVIDPVNGEGLRVA